MKSSFVGSLEAEGSTGGWVGLESILAWLTVNDGGTMGFVSVFEVHVGWTLGAKNGSCAAVLLVIGVCLAPSLSICYMMICAYMSPLQLAYFFKIVPQYCLLTTDVYKLLCLIPKLYLAIIHWS